MVYWAAKLHEKNTHFLRALLTNVSIEEKVPWDFYDFYGIEDDIRFEGEARLYKILLCEMINAKKEREA